MESRRKIRQLVFNHSRRICRKRRRRSKKNDDIRAIRKNLFCIFNHDVLIPKTLSNKDIDETPSTRSTNVSDDYWLVDMPAAKCAVVETRRLDRYVLERILSLEGNTQLLLLVREIDDIKLFNGKGAKVESIQQLPRKKINGFAYRQLKCKLDDVSNNRFICSGSCTVKRFEDDFNNSRGGFTISFEGTNLTAHFTWKRLISDPLSFMFFGPPLTKSQRFDHIFEDVKNLDTLHSWYLAYNSEFVGDLNASLFLLNAYIHRRLSVVESKLNKNNSQTKCKGLWKISPDLFESKSVLEFLNKFDTHCRNRIEFIICNFCTHDNTVVSDSDLDGFIAEVPKVFGDFWRLLCDLRGIKLK